MHLARVIGYELPATMPAPVAAALLRRRLSGALGIASDQQVTQGQRQYLRELAIETGSQVPDDLEDVEVLDSWVAVLQARRAADHLERLTPQPGEVALARLDGTDRTGEVSSISADGRLNSRGGRGRGVRPHRVVRMIRATDDYYVSQVYAARQQAAAQASNPERVGSGQLAQLTRWKVTG